MAYVHREVVHDSREVVGWGAVRLAHDEIVDSGETDLTSQHIPKDPASHGWSEVQRLPTRLLLHLVDQLGLKEPSRGLLVVLSAFALPIRSLIETQAEPPEILQLGTLEYLRAPHSVGVLYTQDELTVVETGEEVV